MNTWTKDKDCTVAGLVLWALEAAERSLVEGADAEADLDADLGRQAMAHASQALGYGGGR